MLYQQFSDIPTGSTDGVLATSFRICPSVPDGPAVITIIIIIIILQHGTSTGTITQN